MNLVKVKILEKISPYNIWDEIEMREDLANGIFKEKVKILEEKTEEKENKKTKKEAKNIENKAILENNETK